MVGNALRGGPYSMENHSPNRVNCLGGIAYLRKLLKTTKITSFFRVFSDFRGYDLHSCGLDLFPEISVDKETHEKKWTDSSTRDRAEKYSGREV